jgi:2-oxoglutarate ferredoxin oxidoreductase subunit delta
VSRGRPEFDRERCKGCGLCIGACPEKILAMSRDQFNRQGLPFATCFEEERCTACMSCAIICPDMAIRIYRLVPAADPLGTSAANPLGTSAANPLGTSAAKE